MELKTALLAARTKACKTQERVALEAGMHTTQYNGYERGRSRPSASVLERLAGPLGTTVVALLGQQDVAGEPTDANISHEFETVESLRESFRLKLASLLKLHPDNLIVRVELGAG